MPGKDGKGPMGLGALTGRGLGVCKEAKSASIGLGNVPRVGRCAFGKGLFLKIIDSETRNELLRERRSILEKQLEVIDSELNK